MELESYDKKKGKQQKTKEELLDHEFELIMYETSCIHRALYRRSQLLVTENCVDHNTCHQDVGEVEQWEQSTTSGDKSQLMKQTTKMDLEVHTSVKHGFLLGS